MKGTLLKDLKNLKGQLLYYAFLVVVFFVVGALSGNLYFYVGLSMFCGAVAPVSAIAYDEKDNWDKFALASGVSRKELAAARYLLGLLIFIPIWALSFVFFAIPAFRTQENLFAVLMFGGMGLIVTDVVLPLVFRIGVEKARAVYLLVVLAVMLLSVGAASFIELIGGDPAFIGACLLFAAGVAGVFVSFVVSVGIYKKKDF